MSYNSYFYLFVFLEAVFLLWLITPRRFRWTVLLLGSYALLLYQQREAGHLFNPLHLVCLFGRVAYEPDSGPF